MNFIKKNEKDASEKMQFCDLCVTDIFYAYVKDKTGGDHKKYFMKTGEVDSFDLDSQQFKTFDTFHTVYKIYENEKEKSALSGITFFDSSKNILNSEEYSINELLNLTWFMAIPTEESVVALNNSLLKSGMETLMSLGDDIRTGVWIYECDNWVHIDSEIERLEEIKEELFRKINKYINI